MNENEFDFLVEEYILPASFVPLSGWNTGDLVSLMNAIEDELQLRAEQAQNAALST